MSRSAWWRLKHYIWLLVVSISLLLVVAFLTFVFIDVFLHTVLHISLKDLQEGDTSVIIAIISFLVPLLMGGLSAYTNYKSQLGYLLSLAVRDLKEQNYDNVRKHYDDYTKLSMHVIWPSQTMEFYGWWAEIASRFNHSLRKELFGEAVDLLKPHAAALEEVINTLTVLQVERLSQENDLQIPPGHDCATYLLELFSPFLQKMCLIEKLKFRKILLKVVDDRRECNQIVSQAFSKGLNIGPRKILPLRDRVNKLRCVNLGKDISIPDEIDIGKLFTPLNLVVSPIRVPLSEELQSKVLRFYLHNGEVSERNSLEEWAGAQRRHDYHVEIAWVKAGTQRPPKAWVFYPSEEDVIRAFGIIKSMPFRSGERIVSKFFVSPNRPGKFLEYLQGEKHQVILGKPGSGKTWLAQMLDEKLSKAGLKVYCYSLALGHETFPEGAIEAIHAGEKTFLIISEAEELIKKGMDPGSVWKILGRMIWNEKFFRRAGLFIKLIVPNDLEPFIRNSISMAHAPVELVELQWSDEDLLKMWKERLGLHGESVNRDSPTILSIADPSITEKDFRLKREWKDAYRRKVGRKTKGADEYIVSLAEGSPKCLMALGRAFLQYAAAKCRDHEKEGACQLTPKEFYETLATLLEAYYGLRAKPIPECLGPK